MRNFNGFNSLHKWNVNDSIVIQMRNDRVKMKNKFKKNDSEKKE